MTTTEVSEKFEEILRFLNDSRDSIKAATRFALEHKEHYTTLFKLIFRYMKETPQTNLRYRTALFYLVDSICQNSKKEGITSFPNLLEGSLNEVLHLVIPKESLEKIKQLKIFEKVLKLWKERNVISLHSAVTAEETLRKMVQSERPNCTPIVSSSAPLLSASSQPTSTISPTIQSQPPLCSSQHAVKSSNSSENVTSQLTRTTTIPLNESSDFSSSSLSSMSSSGSFSIATHIFVPFAQSHVIYNRPQPQSQICPQESSFVTVASVPSTSFFPSYVSSLGYGSNQAAMTAMNNALYSHFLSQNWRNFPSNYYTETEMNEQKIRQTLKEIEEYRREKFQEKIENSLRPVNDKKFAEFEEMWNEINQNSNQNNNENSETQKIEQKSKNSAKNPSTASSSEALPPEKLNEILNSDLDLELEEDLKESNKAHFQSLLSSPPSTDFSQNISASTNDTSNSLLDQYNHVSRSTVASTEAPVSEMSPLNSTTKVISISNYKAKKMYDSSKQPQLQPQQQSQPRQLVSPPLVTCSEMETSQTGDSEPNEKENSPSHLESDISFEDLLEEAFERSKRLKSRNISTRESENRQLSIPQQSQSSQRSEQELQQQQQQQQQHGSPSPADKQSREKKYPQHSKYSELKENYEIKGKRHSKERRRENETTSLDSWRHRRSQSPPVHSYPQSLHKSYSRSTDVDHSCSSLSSCSRSNYNELSYNSPKSDYRNDTKTRSSSKHSPFYSLTEELTEMRNSYRKRRREEYHFVTSHSRKRYKGDRTSPHRRDREKENRIRDQRRCLENKRETNERRVEASHVRLHYNGASESKRSNKNENLCQRHSERKHTEDKTHSPEKFKNETESPVKPRNGQHRNLSKGDRPADSQAKNDNFPFKEHSGGSERRNSTDAPNIGTESSQSNLFKQDLSTTQSTACVTTSHDGRITPLSPPKDHSIKSPPGLQYHIEKALKRHSDREEGELSDTFD